MAWSAYLMWLFLAVYCYFQGWFRMNQLQTVATFSAVVAYNLILYGVFRSGFNKRFEDPSLTMFQMTMATLAAMIVAYFTDRVRAITLLLYMVVFVFGVFRLKLRQFFILALYALGGYGYVILMLATYQPDRVVLKEEVLYWLVLAAVLSWFAAIGSYIAHLRKKLVKANAELSWANEKIKQSAIIDELTGLYNRRHIMGILQREKALSDRGDPPFSLCIFDLDDFKHINDTYGHLAGDLVLRTLAQEMKKSIREQDYLARYGGEEFLLVLAYPELKDGATCVERLKNVSTRIDFPGLPAELRVTMSMGLTSYRPFESIDALIARADAALYKAKAAGKNRIWVEGTATHERVTLGAPSL